MARQPLLVEVAGPEPVDLAALGHPHSFAGRVASEPALCRADDWAVDLLVWASEAPVPASIERRFPLLVTPLAHPVFHVRFDPAAPTPMPWSFRCNLCGTVNHRIEPLPGTRSCERCRSNLRYRATAQALTAHAFGSDIALVDAPPCPEVSVLGISDWPPLARRLARTFTYVNTHLDIDPRLDLSASLPSDMVGRYDVVLAGDVLEHVVPPLPAALVNLRRLIRPGGVAIVTVPWSDAEPVEHFPELHRFELRDHGGRAVLINERRDGSTEWFDDVRFHGPGRNVEMRMFSKASLIDALVDTGFAPIRVCDEDAVQHGIAHRPGRPVPVVAHVPG